MYSQSNYRCGQGELFFLEVRGLCDPAGAEQSPGAERREKSELGFEGIAAFAPSAHFTSVL